MRWDKELACSRCDFVSDDLELFEYIPGTYEILCLDCLKKEKQKKEPDHKENTRDEC